ncbi:uncharacterized protein LOC134851994 [Symsagittifera roscoffensis]|uniref:uncharacterized protein LOC134851994 n=1 Tax=Symsagittifera roscoffensis TaxID=84072 RepID=UPI00307B1D6E
MLETEHLVFALGSHNWQQSSQFTTGSAIVHELQHRALNDLPGVKCYSLWPSNVLKSPVDRDDYRVVELNHPVPICEGVHPQSSLRFHSLSTDQFSSYMDLLVSKSAEYINYIEEKHGRPVEFMMAHHVFNNAVVLTEVNKRRELEGRKRVPLFVFAHGTGLLLYLNELQQNPDFPIRFYPWIREEVELFENNELVQGVFMTKLQESKFSQLFPNFPTKKIKVVNLGYDQSIFRKIDTSEGRNKLASNWNKVLYENCDSSNFPAMIGDKKGLPNLESFEHIVAFCGKLDEIKRLEVLLNASKLWENEGRSIVTLIAGGAMKESVKTYVDMAYEDLRLQNTYFLGPMGQLELAKLFNITDVLVLPSKSESFGMVLIEALACGASVIGMESWAPFDFHKENVGVMLKDGENTDEIARTLHDAVAKSVHEKGDINRRDHCALFALNNFSNAQKVKELLETMKKWELY